MITVIDEACHHNVVSLCARFELPDLLASHTLTSQVKSQVIDLWVQVKFRVIFVNCKSSNKSKKWATQVRLQLFPMTRVYQNMESGELSKVNISDIYKKDTRHYSAINFSLQPNRA